MTITARHIPRFGRDGAGCPKNPSAITVHIYKSHSQYHGQYGRVEGGNINLHRGYFVALRRPLYRVIDRSSPSPEGHGIVGLLRRRCIPYTKTLHGYLVLRLKPPSGLSARCVGVQNQLHCGVPAAQHTVFDKQERRYTSGLDDND